MVTYYAPPTVAVSVIVESVAVEVGTVPASGSGTLTNNGQATVYYGTSSGVTVTTGTALKKGAENAVTLTAGDSYWCICASGQQAFVTFVGFQPPDGSGSGGGVTSFNTRTGAVVPANADYLAVASGGLTGATAATRYVGGTASGAPVSGTFAVGDFSIDQTGKIWICTTAGTPGSWSQVSSNNQSYITVNSGTGDTTGTTLAAGDLGCERQAVDALTYTVPSDTTIGSAYTEGEGRFFILRNLSSGVVTITGATGVTVNGVSAGSVTMQNEYQSAFVEETAASTWAVTVAGPVASPDLLRVDNVTSGGTTSGAGGTSWTHYYGGAPNGMVVVGVLQVDASNLVTGCTYGGVSMTSTGTPYNVESGGNWLMGFYLLNPPAGAATVAISVSGSVTALGGAAVSFAGAKQSGQPDNYAVADNTGTTGLLSASITPVATGCWVMALYRVTSAFNATCLSPNFVRLGNAANQGFAIIDTNSTVPAASTTLQGNATSASQSQGLVLMSIAPA